MRLTTIPIVATLGLPLAAPLAAQGTPLDAFRDNVAATTAFPTPDAVPPPIAIVGATLVDGTGAAAVRNAVVVMREGRIACAGPRATCPVPADADTVSALGKWIIPGLIDTHVHFSQTGWVDGRPDALDLRDRYPYETVEAELHARPERFFRSYLCS